MTEVVDGNEYRYSGKSPENYPLASLSPTIEIGNYRACMARATKMKKEIKNLERKEAKVPIPLHKFGVHTLPCCRYETPTYPLLQEQNLEYMFMKKPDGSTENLNLFLNLIGPSYMKIEIYQTSGSEKSQMLSVPIQGIDELIDQLKKLR